MKLRDERGAAALELTITAPVLLLLLAVMLAGARVIQTKSELISVARETARAAVAQANADLAVGAGDTAGTRTAAALGLDPTRLSILQLPGDFERGSLYSVTVSYEVKLADLPGLGMLPASFVVRARQVETVERYISR